MRPLLPGLALPILLGGCAVYPDGSIGPLPPVAPAGTYAPAPAPPVVYAPPAYGYQPGVPIQVVPVAPPPPVVVAPSIGIGLGFGWGRGYWGPPRGYWGRPYYRRW